MPSQEIVASGASLQTTSEKQQMRLASKHIPRSSLEIGCLQLAARQGEGLLLDWRILPKPGQPVDLRITAEPG